MSATGDKVRFWGHERNEEEDGAFKKSHERDLAFIKAFLKFWAIPLLIVAGLGVYLSLSIVPWVMSAMIAAGLAPWLAAVVGVIVGGGLVLGLLAAPLSRFLQGLSLLDMRSSVTRIHGHHSRVPLPKAVWFTLVLSLLVGLGFGIYLSTLIVPLVINALTAMGLSYGWSLLAGITASMILIAVTMDLLAQPLLILEAITKYYHLINCILGIISHDDFSGRDILKGKGTPYAIVRLVGRGFGVYLATLLAPLIISSLGAMPGISVAIAGFIAVAVSVALTAICARVFSVLGMWVDGLVSRIALARQSKLSSIEIEVAKMDIVQAVVLGGPFTELTFFVRPNDGLIPDVEKQLQATP